jgi:hypothetical protein
MSSNVVGRTFTDRVTDIFIFLIRNAGVHLYNGHSLEESVLRFYIRDAIKIAAEINNQVAKHTAGGGG